MLKIEDIQEPGIFSRERWADITLDGTVVFLDPATGEELTTTHQWIEEESRLSAGREHLHRVGSAASALILSAEHYMPSDLPTDYESMVRGAVAYGYEAVAWNREAHSLDMEELRKFDSLHSYWFLDTFQERVLRAAASSIAPSFSYDVEDTRGATTPSPVDSLLCAMGLGLEAAAGTPGYMREQHPEIMALSAVDRQILELAFEVMRQEYWPGKLGYELSEYNVDVRNGEILLTTGRAHEVVFKEQLTAYGLSVNPRQVDPVHLPKPLLEREIERFTRIYHTKRVSMHDISELTAPYKDS